MDSEKHSLREKILGLGKLSLRKSYYPSLKKSTEELHRYKALLDKTSDSICLLEVPSLKFIDMNQSALELFGIKDSSYENLGLYDKIGNSNYELISDWLCLSEDELNKSLKFRIEYFSDELGACELELNLTYVEFSEVEYAVCVIHDMTEYYSALNALSYSEENLKITLDSIGDAVIATDCDGIITRMNQIASNLTGWEINKAIGMPLSQVFKIISFESRKEVESPVRKVLKSGQIVGLANHTLLISKNGAEHHISDSGAPIMSCKNEIVGVVLVFRDVTKEHEIEEKLFQSQKMESIGQLAGGIAHDFNNMLTGILASSGLLQKKLNNSDPSILRMLKIIEESAKKASELTQKLLAFGRKGKLVMKKTCIHDSIKSATDLLERSIDKKIEILLDLNAESTYVFGDPNQLDNLFLNLGLNSRDALPDGGSIKIETQNIRIVEESNEIIMYDLKPGKYIQIKFSDNGSGIPESLKSKVFEPFFTTKQVGQGTGLGLAAVYGTVRDHGGIIEIERESGPGTIFNICLPVEDDFKLKTESKPNIDFPHTQGCILIIDDEDIIRDTASEILEELGYEVYTAEDGLAGRDLYQKHWSRVDVVILDMIMPIMSGKECFEELKKINPDVKVLISSGFTSGEAMKNINIDDAAGFLKKPFTVSDLYDSLKQVIIPNDVK